MRFFFLALILSLLVIDSAAWAVEFPPIRHPFATRLCAALDLIQPGDRVPVRLEGILTRNWYFSDYLEPRCSGRGPSTTYVELADGFELPLELAKLLKKDGEAYVILMGDLYGPERGLPDDLSVRELESFLNRRKLKGYDGSRTKFQVDEVMYWRAAADAPRFAHIVLTSPFPRLVSASMPLVYPALAYNLELSGEVRVQLTVEAGNITNAEVISGDRMLVPETLQVIETWKFEPTAKARFTTTFSYRIGTPGPGARDISVHSDLPYRVEIVAPRRVW